MARCEQGYLCEVCGLEVEDITDSDLYLRYVLGEVDPETLHQSPERHLRCNPSLSQFIGDPEFEPVEVVGPFSKVELDPEYVAEETARVSAAYRRLREIYRSSRNTPITEYLDPEIQARWARRSGGPSFMKETRG
jgi:hypothetical protein